MANEFDEKLSEVTGAPVTAEPEIEQARAGPAEASNAFDQALSEIQEAAPARSQDTPEPGGGMEH